MVPPLVTMFLHGPGRCFQFVKQGVEHGRNLVHWYAYGVDKGLLQTHGDAIILPPPPPPPTSPP